MTSHQSVMDAVKPMTDYLLRLKFRFASRENPDPDPLRRELKRQLQDMELRLSDLAIPGIHSRFDTIKYIFAALSDEIIFQSGWHYADEWLNRPLEAEFSQSAIAGERFYELLEREGLTDPLMAGLFYTCLVLGFGRDRQDYYDLKQRLYLLLPDTLPENEFFLSPGAETYIPGDTPRLPPLFGVMTLIVITLVSTVLYMTASHMLWEQAADFLRIIRVTLLKEGY